MKNITKDLKGKLTGFWERVKDCSPTISFAKKEKPEVIDPDDLEQAIEIVRTTRERFNAAVRDHYANDKDFSHMRAFLNGREWSTDRHDILESIKSQRSPKATVETILRVESGYRSEQEAKDKIELILKGVFPSFAL